MSEQTFDLFGDVCRLPSGKRGRPAHVRTQEIDNKIMMLLALGWSNQRIANACHISVPTLRRYYFSVLNTRDIQRDRLDSWQLMKVVEQVKQGNVGAMRLLSQLVSKNDMMLAQTRIDDAEDKKAKEPLGKKEQARRAAKEICDTEGDQAKESRFAPGLH